MSDPLALSCRTNYPAYHHGGERSQASIRYIVLHSTEGGTAKSVAEWFMNPLSGGSANLVVSDLTCYRVLADTIVPWGAPPLNTHGFHIEQVGYAAWTRAQWLAHEATIQRAAYKASLRCKWYRIPAKVLDVAALEKDFGGPITPGGVPQLPGPLLGGIVTHATVSAAYHESTHTDPGAGYPMDRFMFHLDRLLTGTTQWQ